jgi:ribonuclease G
VTTLLVSGPGRPILEIEKETGKHFHFEGTEALPIDHFAVVLEGTREEVEERALPFREGEEVMVQIEEPHMYNDDDAVAKLDGYVISVTGAGRLVGQKALVRIEKVGRSAAQASLVNGAGPDAADEADDADTDGDGDGDADDRPRRRRGRRGGRGRRRSAPAESS